MSQHRTEPEPFSFAFPKWNTLGNKQTHFSHVNTSQTNKGKSERLTLMTPLKLFFQKQKIKKRRKIAMKAFQRKKESRLSIITWRSSHLGF